MNLKEYEALLNDVESRLDRLRALYEQYFQGLERLEPQIPKKEVERRIQALRKAQPRNTALRFRTQQVIQKYTTYLTYWNRVARQIEEGTFRRDVMRARQRRDEAREAHRLERESQRPQAWAIDIDVDVDVDREVEAALAGLDDRAAPAGGRPASVLPPRTPLTSPPASAAPPGGAPARKSISPFAIPRSRSAPPDATRAGTSAPTATFSKPRDPLERGADGDRRAFRPPPGVRPPVAAPAGPPTLPSPPRLPTASKGPAGPPPLPTAPARAGGDGVDVRGVYDRYLEARRRNNERTDNVRLESIEKSIKQMLPKLREKHGGKRIDFEVVLKNGKVGLKPVPK